MPDVSPCVVTLVVKSMPREATHRRITALPLCTTLVDASGPVPPKTLQKRSGVRILMTSQQKRTLTDGGAHSDALCANHLNNVRMFSGGCPPSLAKSGVH